MASNFSDIVKYQRAQGRGVLGSLGSAMGQSTLQRMDPRNYLFNRKGAMASLFPGLKGYQAKTTSDKISSGGSSGGFSTGQVELITEKLDQVRTQTGLVAKNTLVLPSLARDMHLVKQNIIKLVKLQGGTPTTKAGDFFSRQMARESAYESKFGNKPTPVVKTEQKKEGGFFSNLFSGGLSGILSNLVSTLVKGGLIVGALAAIGKAVEKFFSDPDFREKVFTMIKDFFYSDFGKALMIGVGVVVGVFATFKLALLALEAAVLMAARKIGALSGIPGGAGGIPTDTPDSDRNKPGQKGPTKDKNGRTLPPRDAKGRFTKLPKPGTSSVGIGRAAGIAAILGLLVDSVYTSEDDIAIIRDSGFSKSKIFEKLSEEDQAQYLANVYDKSVLEEDLKKFRQELMSKYNIKETGAILRWKERYVETPAAATPDSPTPYNAAKDSQAANSPSSTATSAVTQMNGASGTFNGLSRAQQDAFLNAQYEREGNKPGNLAYDLNNPGAMLYADWQKAYGAVPNNDRGKVFSNGKKVPFAEFPSFEQGREAQRALWASKYGNMPLSQAVATWSGTKIGTVEHANYTNALMAAANNSGANLNNSSVAMADGKSSPSSETQTVNNTQVAQAAPAFKPMEVPDLKVYDSDLAKFLLEPVII